MPVRLFPYMDWLTSTPQMLALVGPVWMCWLQELANELKYGCACIRKPDQEVLKM